MITQWNEATESLAAFEEKMNDFMCMVPQSPELYKQKNNLKKMWDKVRRNINEVDRFITPPAAIEVKIPKEFNKDKFVEAWQVWKDYLEEQHAVKMRSRMEYKALEHLFDISGKDAEKAMKYLNYAIAKGSKSFYKVDDVTKPNKKENYDPDFN